jgi:hypothetical protein
MGVDYAVLRPTACFLRANLMKIQIDLALLLRRLAVGPTRQEYLVELLSELLNS